jgi:hypothetical protein
MLCWQRGLLLPNFLEDFRNLFDIVERFIEAMVRDEILDG